MNNQTLDRLIEAVNQAADSPRNRARGKRSPCANFAMEEPIAWTILFGYDANRYLSDPGFYFEQILRQKLWRWETFPEDNTPLSPEVPAWLGWYPEYTVVGLSVEFNPRGVPNIQTDHPISKSPDLRLLKPVDFKTSGWMPRILKWHDDLTKIAAGRMAVPFAMPWCRGCLDLAIQLRGYENFIDDTMDRPGFVHDLLKFLVEQRCRWWQGYYDFFGQKPAPINIADDWINVPFITPAMFEDFILPRYLDIERFHGGITSIHSCGNQVPVQKYLLTIKSLNALEVSPWSDLDQSLQNIPVEKWLSIALHPNDVLCATADAMRSKLQTIKGKCARRQYGIYTSGLTPLTEDANEFIDKIRRWNRIANEVFQ
jgi:hypothetical protein